MKKGPTRRRRSQREQGRGRGRGHGRGKGRSGHNSFNYGEKCQASRGRGRRNDLKQYGKSYDKSQFKCHNCQKYDHYAWECKSHTNNVEEKVNYVEKDEAEPTLLLAYREEERGEKNLWYLDNEANNHMCKDITNKNKFVELDESVCGNVTLGDLSKVSIKGKDTILLEKWRTSIYYKCLFRSKYEK
jgi:hypothetical protein